MVFEDGREEICSKAVYRSALLSVLDMKNSRLEVMYALLCVAHLDGSLLKVSNLRRRDEWSGSGRRCEYWSRPKGSCGSEEYSPD